MAGKFPPFFQVLQRRQALKELSIFIDEFGDFGEYDHYSLFLFIVSKDTDLYKLYNTNIHEKIAEQKKRLEQQ